jgi:prefoldin subunit 5
MLRLHHVVLFLPLIVFSSAHALSADPPAMNVLKETGLTRSGRIFVIEAEDPVIEKSSTIRSVQAEYTATLERKNETELATREFAQLEERRVELQQNLDQLNQQINQQGFQQGNIRQGGFGQAAYFNQLISQRNMIQMNLTQVVAAQRPVKPLSETDKKTLDEESKKSLVAAKAVLAEIRASVDAVTKRYDELNSDASVKSALLALEKAKVGSFKLGPSPTFKTTVKALEKAERVVLAKKSATISRKKVKSKR